MIIVTVRHVTSIKKNTIVQERSYTCLIVNLTYNVATTTSHTKDHADVKGRRKERGAYKRESSGRDKSK